MRTHVLFLILWGLLFISRPVGILHSVGEYRIAAGLEGIIQGAPYPRTEKEKQERDENLRNVVERKRRCLEEGIGTGVEMLLLAGVGVCFARAWRQRRESASPYVWTRRSRAETSGDL